MNARTFRGGGGARVGAGATAGAGVGAGAGAADRACSDGALEPKPKGTDGMVSLGIATRDREVGGGVRVHKQGGDVRRGRHYTTIGRKHALGTVLICVVMQLELLLRENR